MLLNVVVLWIARQFFHHCLQLATFSLINMLLYSLILPMCIESPSGLSFGDNLQYFTAGKYKIMGQMLATMIVQGGESPCLFTPIVTNYITGGNILDLGDLDIEDIPKTNVRNDLVKVI